MMAKVTTLSTKSTGRAARMRFTMKSSIGYRLRLSRARERHAPLPCLVAWCAGRLAGRPGQRFRLELVLRTLAVGGNVDPLADDVVLGPVVHVDRRAGWDVGKPLVDDQRAGILGQADGVD